MIETEDVARTLCDCTIEVAELFASMPTAGADGGYLLDLLSLRLETSRDRLRQQAWLWRNVPKDGASESAAPC